MPERRDPSLGVLAAGAGAALLGVAAALWSSPGLAVVAGSLSFLAALGVVRLGLGADAPPAADPGEVAPAVPAPTDDVVDASVSSQTSPSAAPEGDVAAHALGTSLELLPEEFLATTLRSRVAVARRALRPLSIVCFEVLELEGDDPTDPVHDAEIVAVVQTTLRESDVAGRLGDAAYVFVLEDTGEDGAVWTAERLRRNLTGRVRQRRFRAGIASYPTHGLDADELWEQATSALAAARDWARDRIEVAHN